MTVLAFYQTVGAVFLGNMLALVFGYGIWRATKAEKKHAVANGANMLTIWLLAAMLLGPGAVLLAGLTIG